ncbi:MAG: DUF1573 domain-containing protein [Planctomycetales bacterium]|nr:DUF1573 domain-containing protein [Planctomycetales bacterium]
MIRILLTAVVGALIGAGLGKMQSTLATSGFEERFTESRATLAEQKGEMSHEDVIANSTGEPKLEVVGGIEYNFGTMQHGETLSREFEFRNIGTGPLNLEMGSSTCKCTVGELDKSILEPGESTIVKLTWTAKTLMPDFGQSATIHTNDPANTNVLLQVKGKIARSFVTEPRELSLGDIPITEGVTQTFQVYAYFDAANRLTNFHWGDDQSPTRVEIEAEKRDIDPQKDTEHLRAKFAYDVTVKIPAGMPLGPINTQIKFESNLGEDIGIMEVPVKGTVVGDIALVGGTSFDPKLSLLKFGNIKSSEGASLNLFLAVQGAGAESIVPEVASVVPAEALNVTIGEPKMVGSRRMFPIVLEVPKNAPEVNFSAITKGTFGKVVIRTNHEITKEIPIYIRLIVHP